MSDKSISNKLTKTLTIKKYKEIIEEEIKEYNEMMKELEETYDDFNEIKQYFKIEALPYIQYCEVHSYKPELTDEQIKELMKKQ
jgi:hypothetical protein